MAPKRKAGGRKVAVKPSAKVEIVEEVKEIVVEEEEAPPPEPAESDKEDEDEKPSSKKAKTEEKKVGAKRGRKGKAAPKPSPKKKATKEVVAEPAKEPKAKSAPASKSAGVSKVIIEASKECTSIKTRAAKVQTGLKEALPELEVVVNPDKPRKGCFEIRDQDGNAFVSLLGMPRPYTKLRNLDLDKTVEEIVAKIK